MAEGEWYPYYLTDRVTLDANGAGQSVLAIGQTEEFEAEEIQFFPSSGTFRITQIQDSAGKGYTNASITDPLVSEMFITALDQRSNFPKFDVPLRIERNGQISITFASGTGAATIDVCLKGRRRTIT